MKIEDLLVSEQVDEGIGSAIGKGLGAVGKGIGAVASVPQGIGRAIKKGYQGGVATIAGDPNPNTATPAGAGARGNVPQATQAQQPQGAVSTGVGNIGSSLANITGFGGGASTGAAPAGTNAVAPAGGTTSATGSTSSVSPLQDKKFMGTLQALKGNDIETVRQVLKSRAAVAESLDEGWRDVAAAAGQGLKRAGSTALQGAKQVGGKVAQGAKVAGDAAVQGAKWAGNKAVQGAKVAGQAIANAPDTLGTVAGKVGGAGTRFSQAYQNARGGYMTIQDLQRSIAAMSPKDAGEALQFFNSIHPEAASATGTPNLQVQQGGRSATPESVDELASMKNMLDILKTR